MDRTIHKVITGFFSVVCLFACTKEKQDNNPLPQVGRKLLIACEGSLGNGNSELDIYFPKQDSLFASVFKNINGRPLGDVFQSLSVINGRYYLCVNNSDKIEVLDENFSSIQTIAVNKPRYIVPADADRAYVSSLFHNKLFVLNTGSNAIVDSVLLPAMNPEGMVRYHEEMVICPWDTANDQIYFVHTKTNRITDSIRIDGRAPQAALVDNENKLWVLAGNMAKGKAATLTRIDPGNKQVLKTYYFPAGADPMRPIFNEAKDTIYFIEVNYNGGTEHNGIYRMSVHDQQLPAEPFIAARQFQYFWALGIDPQNGDFYVGDPRGFIQKGSVLVYANDGSFKKEIKTGVGPGHFYFIQ